MIQASSAQSIAGTIVIRAIDTDIAGSITQLPESFLDASTLLPQRCAARHGRGQSSFVVAGRGGTPTDPDGYLPSFNGIGLTTQKLAKRSHEINVDLDLAALAHRSRLSLLTTEKMPSICKR